MKLYVLVFFQISFYDIFSKFLMYQRLLQRAKALIKESYIIFIVNLKKIFKEIFFTFMNFVFIRCSVYSAPPFLMMVAMTNEC